MFIFLRQILDYLKLELARFAWISNFLLFCKYSLLLQIFLFVNLIKIRLNYIIDTEWLFILWVAESMDSCIVVFVEFPSVTFICVH